MRPSPICRSVRPPLPTAGRHLVYLDVWERELTWLERPELVEIAVGVETSSRLQTVWQVRVLDTDAGANTSCATPDEDMPGWSTVIAPSTGVLTTGTFDVAAGRRPLRAAADRRLPRPREPALPGRDPRSRPARRHCDLQMVARKCQRRLARRQHDLGHRTRARQPRARRRAAFQHRRLGRDHRRPPGVLAAGRRDAPHHRHRGDPPHQLHAGTAGPMLPPGFPQQRLAEADAICACAAGIRRERCSGPTPAARRCRSAISMPPDRPA